MAHFEPTPPPRRPASAGGPPRPPRPRPDREPPAPSEPDRGARDDFDEVLDGGLAATERIADQVTKAGRRRWVPSFGFLVPKFVRRRFAAFYDQLPEEMRYRLSVVSGFLQPIFIVVLGALMLAVLMQAITNQTIFEPKNAKDVLGLVDDPSDVSYSVETIRVKDIDNSLLRLDSLRGFEVRPEDGKMRATVSGVGARSFRMVSDAKTALVQFDGQPAQILRKVPSKQAIRPILASDLKPVAGKIADNKATVAGSRGWFLTFTPTKELLLRMLSAKTFQEDNADLRAIRAGDYKVRYATATVTRSSRHLYQIDVLLDVNGARLRILTTYRHQNTGALKDLVLDRNAQTIQPVN